MKTGFSGWREHSGNIRALTITRSIAFAVIAGVGYQLTGRDLGRRRAAVVEVGSGVVAFSFAFRSR